MKHPHDRPAPAGAPKVADTAASIFAALSDPTRLALAERLGVGGPQTTTALAAGEPVTRQAITKHLEVLVRVGLATSARRGRERIWSVDARGLDRVRTWLDAADRAWRAAAPAASDAPGEEDAP